jgi:hypothetical protein
VLPELIRLMKPDIAFRLNSRHSYSHIGPAYSEIYYAAAIDINALLRALGIGTTAQLSIPRRYGIVINMVFQHRQLKVRFYRPTY